MTAYFLIFQCFVSKERETSEPMQVMRGGRTMKMSIFDIVVGDVVPLKIGDQVRFISEEIIFYDAFKSFKLTIQILRCFT